MQADKQAKPNERHDLFKLYKEKFFPKIEKAELQDKECSAICGSKEGRYYPAYLAAGLLALLTPQRTFTAAPATAVATTAATAVAPTTAATAVAPTTASTAVAPTTAATYTAPTHTNDSTVSTVNSSNSLASPKAYDPDITTQFLQDFTNPSLQDRVDVYERQQTVGCFFLAPFEIMCEFAQQIRYPPPLSNVDVGLAITRLEDLQMITAFDAMHISAWYLDRASRVRVTSKAIQYCQDVISKSSKRELPKVDNIALAHDMNWYYGIEAPRSTIYNTFNQDELFEAHNTLYKRSQIMYHILGQVPASDISLDVPMMMSDARHIFGFEGLDFMVHQK